MKIMIYRWIDGDPRDTIALSKAQTTKSASERFTSESLRAGVNKGMIITFSKAENLYSHNTSLTAKQINLILKLSEVTALKESDVVLINT